LAVLWSEENSRDYLFDAMQRKETHATSGPRILVRMFAGWDNNDAFDDQALCEDFAFDETAEALRVGVFAADGDKYGVPMGSDLSAYPGDGSPVIAVAALRDANSEQGLQRIQIVKSWVDNEGLHHEQIFDVAGGNNNASVDLNSCEVEQPNKQGALCRAWKDPTFNPEFDAVYYARVLENPSCRWAWQQCLGYLETSSFGDMREACSESSQIPSGFQECCLHEHVADVYSNSFKKKEIGVYPATVQERAWTSPVWYNANVITGSNVVPRAQVQ